MRSQNIKRGFTLIELLVVIAIIAILASILFPVFAKAREKARQTTCLSQVRQMATACQMFNQDNSAHYPGSDWVNQIATYLGTNPKVFWCPSDASSEADGPVSYGYSGLLLRADGTGGISEAQISSPTEVGVICDATPDKTYPTGGFVGGGALANDANFSVIPSARHSNGTVVGYADGHAKYISNGYNEKDINNGVTRAFFMASALGLVDNYGGGIAEFTYTSSSNTAGISMAGDYCVSPIMLAAGEVWKKISGAKYFAKGFLGSQTIINLPSNYLMGDASCTVPVNDTTTFAVAKDAFVFIVAKNTKIPVASFGSIVSGQYVANTTNLLNIFVTNAGYSANLFQAYDYDKHSGNRAYLTSSVLFGTPGTACLTCKDDLDMVDKVANDALGIGYCSSAIADPERVTILGIASAGTNYVYPNMNTKYATIFPDSPSWPYVRTLTVTAVGAATGTDAIGQVMLKSTSAGLAALKTGPLFKANYWSAQ